MKLNAFDAEMRCSKEQNRMSGYQYIPQLIIHAQSLDMAKDKRLFEHDSSHSMRYENDRAAWIATTLP